MSGPTGILQVIAAAPLKAAAELRFTIPSDPAALAASVRMVRTTMEWMGFEQDWVFRAELCLQEALLNAHYHGNESDAGREIGVVCSFTKEKVSLEVEDQGHGYDRAEGPDFPPKNEQHGRGLYLIRHYMSSVAIDRRGARIIMSLNKE